MTTLLLTATIAPSHDAPQLSLSDPAERLSQYRDALVYYLTTPGPGWTILFVDNSSYPLDTLRSAAKNNGREDRPVHFLSYASEVPAAWGKGRGEVALIEKALDHFADLLPRDEPVWKITGRHKVRNIGRLVDTQPPDVKVYADFRSVPLVGNRFFGNHWTDTQVIAFTPDGYDAYIRQTWPESSFVLEQRIFQTLQPHLHERREIVPRLRLSPIIEGTNAASGKIYGAGKDRVLTMLRSVSRTVAPWLWI